MLNVNNKSLFPEMNTEPVLINNQGLWFANKWKRYAIYLILLGFAITAFSVIAYKAYKYSTHPSSIEEVPLVRKDLTPLREVPSDPGGEQFSNQDKLIYNNLIDNSTKRQETPKPVASPKAKIVAKEEPKVYKKANPKPKTEAPLSNVFDVLEE